MVQISNGNIVVATEKRSLWESFKRFFRRNRKKIAVVLLVGVGMLMTTVGVAVPFLSAVGTGLIALGSNLASLNDGKDDEKDDGNDDGNDNTTRRYNIT